MEIATRCICCDAANLKASPAVLMPFVANRVFGWEPVEITADWGMRDLQTGHAYSLCNSLQCETCGVIFLDMRFSDAEMAALYDNYRDEAYTRTRERFEPGYRARNELLVAGSTYIAEVERFLLQHIPRPKRMLDWGGDTGLNTPFAGSVDTHHVYDISNKPPVSGVEIVDATRAAANTYDLIVCSNVIEHVPFPARTVSDLAGLMTGRTALYLEVPHEDIMRSAEAPLKRHWHEHINFFTPRSLELLVARSGLRTIATTALEVTAGGKRAHAVGLLAERATLTR